MATATKTRKPEATKSEMDVKPTREIQQAEPTRRGLVFTPRVDIYETEDRLILLADMPGVDTEKLDIQVENRELTLYGRCECPCIEGHELAWKEYDEGDYHRVFLLPEEIDTGHIEASMKNGVLRLELPKAESARPRKIAVKAEQ